MSYKGKVWLAIAIALAMFWTTLIVIIYKLFS